MVTEKKHDLIASDRIEGTAVKRPTGDKIGRIERLMLDKVSGKSHMRFLALADFLELEISTYQFLGRR